MALEDEPLGPSHLANQVELRFWGDPSGVRFGLWLSQVSLALEGQHLMLPLRPTRENSHHWHP